MNLASNRHLRMLIALVLAVCLAHSSFAVTKIVVDPPQITPAKDRPLVTLKDLNNAFIDIAKAVTPSVVMVSTAQILKVRDVNPFMFDPFAEFFGGSQSRQRNQQAPERQFRRQGLGSGVIVSSDGYILTNNHVVQNMDSIIVRTAAGKSYPATVVGTDPKTDVAVIKVNANGLTPIRIGNSDSLQVGEIVMAIGSPLDTNLAHTVTQGIVSAKGRSNVGLAEYEDFIQTDAAINPGNSGGALVNLNGELVGINAAIASQSGGFQGIGFAVPINMAIRVKDMLLTGGRVTRGYMGITIQNVTDKLAQAMNLPGTQGALVGSVAPGSPAEKSGLQSGDVITTLNGQTIENEAQLRSQIASSAPGSKVNITVYRDGQPRDLNVTLIEMPANASAATGSKGTQQMLGFTAANIDKSLADKYDLEPDQQGVVVTDIDQNSNAYDAGVREGDVILSVNRTRIASVSDLQAVVSRLKKDSQVLLLINRQGSGFFVTFTL